MAIELQHEFNLPFQIGAYGDGLDGTTEGTIPVRPGDIIVMATDGLFDNLFMDRIMELVNNSRERENIALLLSSEAFKASQDQLNDSPHALKARNAGFFYSGGKPDDITVIVAVIGP